MDTEALRKQIELTEKLIVQAGKQNNILNDIISSASKEVSGEEKTDLELLKAMSLRVLTKAKDGTEFSDAINEIKTTFTKYKNGSRNNK